MHKYGKNVHFHSNAYLETLLTQLCQPQTLQPQVQKLVEELFFRLGAYALSKELSTKKIRTATRMTAVHKNKFLEATIFDQRQKAVSVSLARAGIPSSQVIYNLLNQVLNPKNVRQDHIWAARLTSDQNTVTGTELGATKIGGKATDSVVFIPDPMGATGGTVVTAVDLYKKKFGGKQAKYVALHLIVTPEYIRKVQLEHPHVHIYAIRLDRGLSPAWVLKTPPGTHWDKEQGLNENQYIVPGAGGLGEILNNSFV